jgi:hypothetical protein
VVALVTPGSKTGSWLPVGALPSSIIVNAIEALPCMTRSSPFTSAYLPSKGMFSTVRLAVNLGGPLVAPNLPEPM